MTSSLQMSLRQRLAARLFPDRVRALIEEGRSPDLTFERATVIVRELAAYVDTTDDPRETARRLVAALAVEEVQSGHPGLQGSTGAT